MANGKCNAPTEVYQRVTGFFRPVQTYNKGKAEEYRERVNYKPETRYHPNHGG